MKLNPKDIVVSVMTRKDGRALIYVYRKSRLKKELQNKETSEFLAKYGYSHLSVEKAVARLKNRLAQSEGFPHEIGVFLGYPASLKTADATVNVLAAGRFTVMNVKR